MNFISTKMLIFHDISNFITFSYEVAAPVSSQKFS